MDTLTATTYFDRSIPSAPPGSAEWMKYLTASKISAIMRHSTYDSWFSLWHRMKGNISLETESEEAKRGHYLEPAVATYLADELPEYELVPSGMWIAQDVPDYAMTPDRIMVPRGAGKLAVAECKSSNMDWEWGTPLSEEIPLGYYDQVTWQIRVLRTHYPVEEAHVGVITNGLNFQRYVVPFDADYAEILEARAAEFMDSLRNNIAPSIDPLDGHVQTYQAIKELHPLIEAGAVELTDDEATLFLSLNEQDKALKERLQAARNTIAGRMGNAQYARWRGHRIFTRQSKQGGTPYMVAAKNLPASTLLEEMEDQ